MKPNVKNRIESDLTIKRILEHITKAKRQTPLTNRVDELDKKRFPQHLMHIQQQPPETADDTDHSKKVSFTLPPFHQNKDSTRWRAIPRRLRISTARQKWENSRYRRKAINRPLTTREIKAAVLDGTIPSGISDTGATSSAGKPGDPFSHTNTPSNKVFHLPTGGTATATTQAKLLHKVREPARSVDMVPSLAEHTLISTSKFADADYVAIYDEKEVNFYDNKTAKIEISEEAVLTGYRCPKTKLWRVPLTNHIANINTDTLLLDSPSGMDSLNAAYTVPSTESICDKLQILLRQAPNPNEAINNVYDIPSVEPAIRYLHAAAGYPTKRTWVKAIAKGNYISWPLLTVKNVNKYFPESEETQYGHMRGQRQGVRSTKVKIEPEAEEATKIKEHDIHITVYDPKEVMYTDQTGKFPHVSSRGNKYMMVLTEIDTNSIWVEAMKNKTEGEMILARRRALARMKKCGILPKKQVLDNEASVNYKQEMAESGMTYELVPPDNHRRNLAEKAIQTWKDHFVAVLSGTAESFPMHLWDRVLPQAELQLTMLRQTNTNPKVSTQLYGPHNYNARPFVPIGMEAMVQDKPNKRKTFAQHCSKCYVLGTSMEHYRCWEMYSPKTRSTRISETVFFKHKYITNPTATPTDVIIAATNRMAAALKNHKPDNMCETSIQALARLETLVNNATLTNNKLQIKQVDNIPAPRVQKVQTEDKICKNIKDTITTIQQVHKDDTIFSPIEEEAQSPRVEIEAASPRVQVTPSGWLSRSHEAVVASSIPTITQDEESPRSPSPRLKKEAPSSTAPVHNTRSRTVRTLTQEAMLSSIEITGVNLQAQTLASRKYPRHMLNAVLNEETGELMEYRHLLVHPKYRAIYKPAYGKELGRLAQGIPGVVKGTNTLQFIHNDEIPADRWKISHTVEYAPTSAQKKKTLTEYDSQLEATSSISLETVEPQQPECSE